MIRGKWRGKEGGREGGRELHFLLVVYWVFAPSFNLLSFTIFFHSFSGCRHTHMCVHVCCCVSMCVLVVSSSLSASSSPSPFPTLFKTWKHAHTYAGVLLLLPCVFLVCHFVCLTRNRRHCPPPLPPPPPISCSTLRPLVPRHSTTVSLPLLHSIPTLLY